MTTKKTTYRYNPLMAKVINDGIQKFIGTSHTGKLSMNRFIDLCINNSVVEYPKRIKQFEDLVSKKSNKITELSEKLDQVTKEFELLKSVLKERSFIEKKINLFLEE